MESKFGYCIAVSTACCAYSLSQALDPALYTSMSTRHSAVKVNRYPGKPANPNFASVQNFRTSPVSAIGVSFVETAGPKGVRVRSITETFPDLSPAANARV